MDYNTVKIIVLTTLVMVALFAIPLAFILKNFVTFDALDKYVGLTQNVEPKILHNVSEELASGYSRDFFIDAAPSIGKGKIDNTMLFYALKGQRVTLAAQAIASGRFSRVTFQVDGCSINRTWDQPFELLEFELTQQLNTCPPDQPNLHTLRVVLPDGVSSGSQIEIKCLVVVYHRVRQHITGEK